VVGISSATLTRTTIISRKKKKASIISSKNPIDKLDKYKQASLVSKSSQGVEDGAKIVESTPKENIEMEEIKQHETVNNENAKPESDN
jgi:hypothetical protein